MSALRSGFTLIEMMVVVLFTSIVLVVAVNFYLDISRASQAATARTRESRRTVAVLDRVARDLEASVLLRKADASDPLSHPWLFYAEAPGAAAGADRIKWVTRGRRPRASAAHESDLELVAYVLRSTLDGGNELWRWSSPQLPESLDREFPGPDEPGSLLLARDVARFGVRFQDEEGAWVSEWDASSVVRSGQLPLAAEIELALLPEAEPDDGFDHPIDLEEPTPWLRRVRLPVRPVDAAALTSAAAAQAGDDDETERDEECVTIAECLGRNPGVYESLDAAGRQRVDSIQEQCFEDYQDELPPGMALEDCP